MTNLAPAICDTHAHLDDPAFDADRDEVLTRARNAGVRWFLNIAYRPEIWDVSVELRRAQPDIELAAGIHPQHADEFTHSQADSLASRLLTLAPRGIGEAGFDFARPGPTVAQQEAAFRWQIELAIETGLPLIIHQREASAQLKTELDRWPGLSNVVLHSFDAGEDLAEWAVERDWYIGVGGLACRPRSSELRRALERVPVDRVLLETDSPYLAPPGAPNRRNEPANLPLVAEFLAPLWGLTPTALCRQSTANAETAFALSGPD